MRADNETKKLHMIYTVCLHSSHRCNHVLYVLRRQQSSYASTDVSQFPDRHLADTLNQQKRAGLFRAQKQAQSRHRIKHMEV